MTIIATTTTNIISTTRQEPSSRRDGVAIIVYKSPKCSTWMQSQKRQNNLCFQGKPFSTTVIQAYAPTSNGEEAEVL